MNWTCLCTLIGRPHQTRVVTYLMQESKSLIDFFLYFKIQTWAFVLSVIIVRAYLIPQSGIMGRTWEVKASSFQSFQVNAKKSNLHSRQICNLWYETLMTALAIFNLLHRCSKYFDEICKGQRWYFKYSRLLITH